MLKRGRHPGKALLPLVVASVLFTVAGFVRGNAFAAPAGQRTQIGLTTPSVSAASLQVAAGPEPATASALRSLGCVLLIMGGFAARSGTRQSHSSRLAGPKVSVHFHQKASESNLAAAAASLSMEMPKEVSAVDLTASEDLLNIMAPASSPAMSPAATLGQTAPRLSGLVPKSSRAKRARSARYARQQHRRVGAKLCASLRYEMPSLSFDSSCVRSKIQMGLAIGASPKIPKSRNAARSNESVESDQSMAELLFRSYNGGDFGQITAIPFEHQWSPASLVRDSRTLAEAL